VSGPTRKRQSSWCVGSRTSRSVLHEVHLAHVDASLRTSAGAAKAERLAYVWDNNEAGLRLYAAHLMKAKIIIVVYLATLDPRKC
jgi:hypothetical protein